MNKLSEFPRERTMPRYKKLVGDLCYLSPCSLQDAEKWAEWDTDLAVSLPLGDEAYVPTSLESARAAISNVLEKREHVFSVVDLETDALIGRGMLFSVDHVHRSAMLGIVLGEKHYWGKGYGQEATRLLVEYGFDLLNLNSIMLGTFGFNRRALHCYEQVGFKTIGKRREARIIGGKKYDAILMDIVADDFKSIYTQRIFFEVGLSSSD
jgi:RimJ/RimL family protein N-acetyltransferase